MDDPIISVIIPTCHRNDLLAKCLECLAPSIQTLPAEQYEVIITDDGIRSTAEEMVRAYYPWARWVAGPKRGPAANRNNGASFAQGEWLAFTDDDCLPEPRWLEAYASAIRPDIYVYEGKTTCSAGIISPLMHTPGNETGGYLWSCNFLISSQLFQDHGGFDDDFAAAAMEDVDLRERLKNVGVYFPFVEAAAVDHPPRRRYWGRRSATMYESDVQFIYKHKSCKPSTTAFVRNVIKYSLVAIKHSPFSFDSILALISLCIEVFWIVVWSKKWQHKYATKYSGFDIKQQIQIAKID